MSGISAVSMINYMNKSNNLYQNQQLLASTKAKLNALGVDTRYITTEAEGQQKLLEARMSRTLSTDNKSQNVSQNQDDRLLDEAKSLASKLNISVSDTDSVDAIIAKIKNKISELKTDAGDDFDKLQNVTYYENEVENLQQTQLSMIDLSASMGLVATQNMSYHNLF